MRGGQEEYPFYRAAAAPFLATADRSSKTWTASSAPFFRDVNREWKIRTLCALAQAA
jgi:hypothetical protein